MLRNLIPGRFRSQGAALAHDLLSVPLAWFFAYWLRLESFTPPFMVGMLKSLAVIIPIQLAAFILFGLYRGIWRFASLPDLQRIIKAVVAGTTISLTVLFLLTRLEAIPRSVPFIYTLLLISILSGSRLLYR